MTRIQEADPKTFRAVERGVQKLTRGCATLEEAAQRYTALLYESFGEGIVLARLFATVPYGELPATNQRFVDELASGAGVGEKITPETLVLSLLGTSGVEPEWNDRRRSRGHVGIPLASAEFVGAIPMVARLLHELGLGFDWIDRADSDAVLKTLGSINGVFYVDDSVDGGRRRGPQDHPRQRLRREVRGALGGRRRRGLRRHPDVRRGDPLLPRERHEGARRGVHGPHQPPQGEHDAPRRRGHDLRRRGERRGRLAASTAPRYVSPAAAAAASAAATTTRTGT